MRILVIEDEKAIRDFVVRALRERAFAVDTAEDGGEGVRLAMINDYDLIILDANLPKKSGFEVCDELRKNGKQLPILVLTVMSDIKTKSAFLGACRADDYVTKPVSIDELLLRVATLLRRPRTLHGNVLECGDLILRMREHQVTKAGEEIELTRKEYSVLRYLMKNKGAMVSQSMIFEHVWDMNADPFSNTVEAHIGNLRKKLGDEEKTLIRTVSGRGYKIRCPDEQQTSEKLKIA